MNKKTKIALIVGVLLILIGILISVSAICIFGHDRFDIETSEFTRNTYEIGNAFPFSSISIDSLECDIKLMPSNNDSCTIVCPENENMTHKIYVDNGTLIIERQDHRAWTDMIGVNIYKAEIVVYLPDNEYDTLTARSISGNITITQPFTFENAELESTSGTVEFSASLKDTLNAQTVSGSITVLNVYTDNITIGSTSGRVTLDECDAKTITVKTVSGDVNGTLMSEKSFTTHTVSGNVDVPDVTSKEKCRISTTSGNIKINIFEQ